MLDEQGLLAHLILLVWLSSALGSGLRILTLLRIGPLSLFSELSLGFGLGVGLCAIATMWLGFLGLLSFPYLFGLLIVMSSSWTEGFPNVIGEAMACGIPCVVTDVGASSWIVGDAGVVVPPEDANALARGCATLIDVGAEGRQSLGQAARSRILEHFSMAYVARAYEHLYEMVVDGPAKPRDP